MGNTPDAQHNKSRHAQQYRNAMNHNSARRAMTLSNKNSQHNSYSTNNDNILFKQMSRNSNTNIDLFPQLNAHPSPMSLSKPSITNISPTLRSIQSGVTNDENNGSPPNFSITTTALNSSAEPSFSSYERKSDEIPDLSNIKGLSAQQMHMLQQHQNMLIKMKKQKEEVLNIFTGEPMDICWVFWKDNVDILPRNKQKELALLLYSHMFQKISAARRLFVRGEIDQQALKFLDMFGFLIRQLKDPDQGSLINTLKGLGRRHASWGVRMEYFEPMMLSLHASLSDHFKHTYTVRVKFCMEQLFTAAASVMTGHDLYSIFGVRHTNMKSLIFLESLELCFADDTGREYLKRFLIQSFCAEIVEYHAIYKQYKGALSDMERSIIGSRIVYEFLTPNSKYELNIKNVNVREDVLKRLHKLEKKAKNGNISMPMDLFDPIYKWMMNEIKQNTWPKFRNTIQSIAVKSLVDPDGQYKIHVNNY